MKNLSILLFFTVSICHLVLAQNGSRNLQNESWQFCKKGDSTWLSAKVSGNVHSDLFEHGVITNPFLGNNEKLVLWVENEDWIYTTNFIISDKELANEHIELQLQNLDTYGKIYLNKHLVAETNNQFRLWNFEVKPYLKKGINTITIVLESSALKGKSLAKELTYTLPGNEAVFTRKAPYQYGWDFGPRLVTCGIDKITLEYWNGAKLLHTQIKQAFNSDSSVELRFVCTIFSDKTMNAQLALEADGSLPNNKLLQPINLKKGNNSVSVVYTIAKPILWWSNGLGSAHLYNFKLELLQKNKLLAEENLRVGIRSIKLVGQKDKVGASFGFELNGKPVFVKGANYIPPHSFLNGLDKSVYKNTVLAAKEANMNMLRVWGGGVYADEEFYKACDENGILVWQDFMFACAMYPGDSAFVENVKAEVKDQVIRLRNHASIALWCGNNEIDEAWNNWGWQKQYNYTQQDSATIEQNYLNLFEDYIPTIIKQEDAARAYWPSSPSIGWGRKESLTQGDSHYWGVWWGMEPFETYEKKVGRFMSEYGFQGMPPLSTFEKYMNYSPNNFDSASFKNHQKHPTGYQTIWNYMARDYVVPNTFEDAIYVSQLLQARGMKIAIEAHRRAKPYCMGTLFWQLNDCWPVTSWSSIDYYGNKKAVYYQVKKTFAPLLISFVERKDTLEIHFISDQTETSLTTVKCKLLDFYGNRLEALSFNLSLESNGYVLFWPINKFNLNENNKNKVVVNVQMVHENDTIEANYYFVKPKDLLLLEPKIKLELQANNVLEISSNVLAKDLYLCLPNAELEASDNYLDILPNQKVRIQLNKGNIDLSKIKTKTLYDIQSAKEK